ncbi:MAG: catalase family protein [Candidatus Saccharibacteria bacterium]|nr:catalase family protein [Pseudorhodobacter sp.]
MNPPVWYRDDLEMPEEDEKETELKLADTLRDILQTTAEDGGHAIRSVHAKGHAWIRAEFEVLSDLPPELAQGLFASPGRHDALIRISTIPGDILGDSISVPRGFALKVLDVSGPRLDGSEAETTQDFIFVNGPAFGAVTAKDFLGNLKLLAKTTNRAEWAKKALSAVLRTAESALEAVGGESGTLKALGGAPNVHPLGQTYYSQTAFRYGAYVAKFAVVPVSASLTGHTEEEIDASGEPDAIRAAMNRDVSQAPMEWEFCVQLLRDEATMPVEDATVVWGEEMSPLIPVARIRAAPQAAWTAERAALDDSLRFSVWTGLAAHRPLGVMNRVRRDTYQMSSEFRARFNGCPVHEPATADLPT